MCIYVHMRYVHVDSGVTKGQQRVFGSLGTGDIESWLFNVGQKANSGQEQEQYTFYPEPSLQPPRVLYAVYYKYNVIQIKYTMGIFYNSEVCVFICITAFYDQKLFSLSDLLFII